MSHTYFWGKAPLEVLVESWITSSVETIKSAFILRRYGVHSDFLELLCWNLCSSRPETGVSGKLWCCLSEVKQLVNDLECGMAPEQIQENRLHLRFICGTLSYLAFLRWHHCPSRLVTMFLGTLWSSIKQIKASYMFDGEHGMALHAIQGNWASSHGEGEDSWFFPSCNEPVVYSPVTLAMGIQNSYLFIEVRIPF